MITQEFKKLIEEKTEHIVNNNPLFIGARKGNLDKKDIEVYLNNLMFFFQHTPVHLAKAQRVAKARGNERLTEFYAEKIREEDGHDQWAKNDLKNLNFESRDTAPLEVINAGNMKLLALAKNMIDKDPSLFIPYMLFMEYFTVLAAPDFMANLEKNHAIPRKFITAIAYHEELDKDHVVEDLKVLDWISNESNYDELKEALFQTAECVDALLGDCVGLQ